jgi:hypothetical protein
MFDTFLTKVDTSNYLDYKKMLMFGEGKGATIAKPAMVKGFAILYVPFLQKN